MKLLMIGLVTGILFGVLMQMARVIRYDKQLAALRFIDMTIIKFMLSTVIVGMVGIYLLRDFGLIDLKIKSTILGANIIGGLVFGIGWALLGYCPATALGATGEGRWDAVWGILGMIFGAGVFAEIYPFLKKTVLTWGDFGKITLPEILNINHWIIIVFLIVIYVLLFILFEKKKI